MSASVPVVAAASIDRRFAQLIQQFGLTKNSFAISLGKTASVVQHLIDGRNKPGFDLLCKVFEIYPNVSRDWLLLGRGPMLVGSNGATPRPPVPAEVSPTEPKPEPQSELPFDPIDLRDVEPRAPRRASQGLAGSRLHPAEIAATLALATAATGPATAEAAAPGPLPAAVVQVPTTAFETPAVAASQAAIPDALGPATLAGLPQMAGPVMPFPSVPPPSGPAQTVGPTATGDWGALDVPLTSANPGTDIASAISVAATAPIGPGATVAPEPLIAPVGPVAQAPQAAPQAAGPGPAATAPPAAIGFAPAAPAALPPQIGPEVYVTAALHAQQLQHQLALAELRNQHLLEQQQMLREMLDMARQAMV